MAHIVKFKNGKYGVRRFTFVRTEYLGVCRKPDWYWWGIDFVENAMFITEDGARNHLTAYRNRNRKDMGTAVDSWFKFWK
jgi:hypothetical protein